MYHANSEGVKITHRQLDKFLCVFRVPVTCEALRRKSKLKLTSGSPASTGGSCDIWLFLPSLNWSRKSLTITGDPWSGSGFIQPATATAGFMRADRGAKPTPTHAKIDKHRVLISLYFLKQQYSPQKLRRFLLLLLLCGWEGFMSNLGTASRSAVSNHRSHRAQEASFLYDWEKGKLFSQKHNHLLWNNSLWSACCCDGIFPAGDCRRRVHARRLRWEAHANIHTKPFVLHPCLHLWQTIYAIFIEKLVPLHTIYTLTPPDPTYTLTTFTFCHNSEFSTLTELSNFGTDRKYMILSNRGKILTHFRCHLASQAVSNQAHTLSTRGTRFLQTGHSYIGLPSKKQWFSVNGWQWQK